MSLYNLVNGVKPATFFVLPVLGKHPDEYPRFRDCFMSDEEHPELDGKIHVYTRVGGGNREDYEAEIEMLRALPGFITDHDDDYDSTFATFVYEIPEQFKADVALALEWKLAETSQAYRDQLYKVFPKLGPKFDELFAAAQKAKAESA